MTVYETVDDLRVTPEMVGAVKYELIQLHSQLCLKQHVLGCGTKLLVKQQPGTHN